MDLLQDSNINLISSPVLCYTKRITGLDSISVLNDLFKAYKSLNKTNYKDLGPACTLLNSILTQKRVYFVLTRRLFLDAFYNDFNIPPRFKKISANRWSSILKSFHNKKYITLVKRGTGRRGNVYKVNHAEILNHLISLGIDAESQLESILEGFEALSKDVSTSKK